MSPREMTLLHAIAEASYWRLAWDWQSDLTGAPARPFDMGVFAPEARYMMNSVDQKVFDALTAYAEGRK